MFENILSGATEHAQALGQVFVDATDEGSQRVTLSNGQQIELSEQSGIDGVMIVQGRVLVLRHSKGAPVTRGHVISLDPVWLRVLTALGRPRPATAIVGVPGTGTCMLAADTLALLREQGIASEHIVPAGWARACSTFNVVQSEQRPALLILCRA